MKNNNITCPRCGEVFTIDEAGYAAIVQQVRDEKFDEELRQREVQMAHEKEQALQVAKSEAQKALTETRAQAEKTLTETKAQAEKALTETRAQADKALTEAKAQAEQALAEWKAQVEIDKAERERELEELRLKLQQQIENAGKDKALAIAQIKNEKEQELRVQIETNAKALTERLTAKDKEMADRLEVKNKEMTDKLAAKDLELSDSKETILRLTGQLEHKDSEAELRERTLKEGYEQQLVAKDEQISYYKDLKTKMSTKMVGETLEQHCEIEFSKIRSTAFPYAYFEKDNDSSSGTKGDYIYREEDEHGVEILSIMFEMKNEMEETATKHKNEDFFDKLDKDRVTKKCEYAVLVSLLEQDSELYNQGIVDVSYRHEKMYVIRPQMFIPMISILRNAALNALEARRQLATLRQQNIDVTNFETKMKEFQEKFGKNYESASNNFNKAIKDIDDTITKLEKIKRELQTCDNQLRLANNKAQDLSIKRLTYGNPTMKAKFAEAKAVNAVIVDEE